ncbi:MAG TPA: hypothetical protein VLG37_00250 [Candidatus Saccharimonadales bacterium]|nr:hypothetical protein [Candidatus Saccharimonadales bacterium]
MAHKLKLPALMTSPSDVGRVRREIESLDDYLTQASLRKPGTNLAQLPKTSRLLSELAELNGLNLLQAEGRQQLVAFLDSLSKTAPILHFSFATDPSAAFLNKIVIWLRQNIHPLILVRVGLQPNIAAGCGLRTANHYYDFSLRERFTKQRPLLLKALNQKGEASER